MQIATTLKARRARSVLVRGTHQVAASNAASPSICPEFNLSLHDPACPPSPNSFDTVSYNATAVLSVVCLSPLKDNYSKTYIYHYNRAFCTSFSIHCTVLRCFSFLAVLLRSDSGFYTLNRIELN